MSELGHKKASDALKCPKLLKMQAAELRNRAQKANNQVRSGRGDFTMDGLKTQLETTIVQESTKASALEDYEIRILNKSMM